MHAISEHARLKAVASPIPAVHSHAPGDCTPPVYMPPVRVMDRLEAQESAFDMQMIGIGAKNRPLTHAARELYYRISDNFFDEKGLDPINEDGVYACIAFAAALTVQSQPLPDHAKSFREVHHALRNAAEELHNVRTILRGRSPLQSLARNADSHSRPWRTHRLDGTARDAGRWRKVPVLAGCCRG